MSTTTQPKMMIIEGLKRIKVLLGDCETIRANLANYSSDLSNEAPTYTDEPTQKTQITSWLQSHKDKVQEIEDLRVRLQITNLLTTVSITLGKQEVTKTIAGWIARRQKLTVLQTQAWANLGSKRIKVIPQQLSTGGTKEVTVRQYFAAADRDASLAVLQSEPMLIDSRLEVINATTPLLELDALAPLTEAKAA